MARGAWPQRPPAPGVAVAPVRHQPPRAPAGPPRSLAHPPGRTAWERGAWGSGVGLGRGITLCTYKQITPSPEARQPANTKPGSLATYLATYTGREGRL